MRFERFSISALFALLSFALCTCASESVPYPDGPHAIALGHVLPNLDFEGVLGDGSFGEISLGDYCRPEGGNLVIVTHGGSWCGTCQWFAEREIADVARLDLIVGSAENAPANQEDASAFKAHFDKLGVVAVDPDYSFRALLDEDVVLPLVVIVDRSSMKVRKWLSNPSSAQLRAALNDKKEAEAEQLIDNMFRPHEWDLLRRTTLPKAPPIDPSNAVADLPAAAKLGKALFFDEGLSPAGISCASCHLFDKNLSDGRARALGVKEGNRRTPSIALAAHSTWHFWDGRADSLWAQALGPLEDEKEQASSRTFVANHVLKRYAEDYRALFGEIPGYSTWPENGKPGDPDFDALPAEQKDAITEVFVNVGKAIAAWERTFRVRENRFDTYLAGDFSALDNEEKYGLSLFVSSGCMQCHWGPTLSDDAFHNIRFPSASKHADEGRLAGVKSWLVSDFRRDGRWSDEPKMNDVVRIDDAQRGHFKTPPLRGVAEAAFFGHDGSLVDLSDVCENYGWGGAPRDAENIVGERDPWLPPFGETTQWGLVPFLETLGADPKLCDVSLTR